MGSAYFCMWRSLIGCQKGWQVKKKKPKVLLMRKENKVVTFTHGSSIHLAFDKRNIEPISVFTFLPYTFFPTSWRHYFLGPVDWWCGRSRITVSNRAVRYDMCFVLACIELNSPLECVGIFGTRQLLTCSWRYSNLKWPTNIKISKVLVI